MHDRSRGALAVVAAASLWGTAGAAQELTAPEVAPWAVAAVRGAGGGVLLLAGALAAGLWPAVRAVLRSGRGPVAVAAVALSAFQLGYLGGIRLVGVAIGTLLAIGSAPVWAGLHATLVGRRPGTRWLGGTGLTIGGAVVLLAPARGTAALPPEGVLLALIAGAGYAAYAISSKRLLDDGYQGTATITVAFLGVGLLLCPLLVVADLEPLGTPTGVVGMLWLTAVTIAVAYVLFLRGLAGVDAPTATTLTLAEPVMAAVLGVAIIGERFTVAALVGVAVIAVGLVLTGGAPPRVPDGMYLPGEDRAAGGDD